MRAAWLIGSFALCLSVVARGAIAPSCLIAQPVPIVVRIGADSPPVLALLRGGVSPRISVVERDSGRPLWTAADLPPAIQQFDAMRASFSGSFAVIDLDGDGVHDRIYAGDLAGRLWRFDLHHGATADRWASGDIWADFSTVAGRGFVAPPDISLSTSQDHEPWLSIAIGTAHTADSAIANRFYVLRDREPFDAWSDAVYARWQPLREADLLAIGRPGDLAGADIDKGYYFDLGAADVLAPSLTVSGRATLALSSATSGDDCQVAVTIASFDIDTAAPRDALQPPRSGASSGSSPAPLVVPAGSGFVLRTNDPDRAVCTLGATHIAACDVDTRPVPLYWRREDAD